MKQIVINGDNIELLKNYPDNYFDAVVTDPPYGLGKEPNAEELMKDWIEKGYHEISGTGFMGKEWDAFIPQPIFWKEVYRVLKYGGHIVSFFGTRTYDWGVMSMRFAGFEVRDCIQWLYGSGFPKSHNIGKAIDKIEGNERKVVGELKNKVNLNATKEGDKSFYESAWQNKEYIDVPITKGNSEWEGWGSALKPANEPIVLARKPLEKGLSIAENILKWGVGGINIDASRVGSETRTTPVFSNDTKTDSTSFNLNSNIQHERIETNQGRFPANIILTHHEDCECKGTKKVKGSKDGVRKASSEFGQNSGWNDHENKDTIRKGTADENGQEEVEDWDCHEDCPIRILDEQSGVKANTRNMSYSRGGGDFIDGIPNQKEKSWFKSEVGGASRFFYVAKASKAERNKGLDGFEDKPLAFSNQAKAELKRGNLEFNGNGITGEGIVGHGNKVNMLKNFHPTVKPIKLMQYLVKMITPPNGIVLDPFCGSGTTGVACKIEGFEFVGLEQDIEYTKIAQARINNYTEIIENSVEGNTENIDNESKQSKLF
jgi:site-specific DNA-methyltransferase (adenine-specific)